MIPLYCMVDRKPISEERVRRGAKTCDKECQKVFRRAFLPRPQGALSEGRRTTTLDKIHQRAEEQCS
jgi:hypothetical protein